MFPGVLETSLQFIFVTSLPNKCYSYHLWLLVITKSGKKERKVVSFSFFFFFKLVFAPCKAEQPLRGMELQEKEAQKG